MLLYAFLKKKNVERLLKSSLKIFTLIYLTNWLFANKINVFFFNLSRKSEKGVYKKIDCQSPFSSCCKMLDICRNFYIIRDIFFSVCGTNTNRRLGSHQRQSLRLYHTGGKGSDGTVTGCATIARRTVPGFGEKSWFRVARPTRQCRWNCHSLPKFCASWSWDGAQGVGQRYGESGQRHEVGGTV